VSADPQGRDLLALAVEIAAEAAYIREWGGRFVVPIPTLQVLDGPGLN